MVLYRYFDQDEYNSYMAGDLSKVGAPEKEARAGNERCLKFFKKLHEVDVMQRLNSKNPQTFYLGVFDIPMSQVRRLKTPLTCPARGYDVDYDVVREFAVPVSKIKPEYFSAVVIDATKRTTADEFKLLISTEEFDVQKQA